MRKLASVRSIGEVLKHPNADKLAIYKVDGWHVIDGIDKYQKGDLIIYCEIDSFLPVKPEFEFLRKSSYKKMGIYEGFRLKTIRLRGTLSQGLLIPMDVLPSSKTFELGDDVTEELGIVKYERPLPANLTGKVRGNFPSFIIKTDEERVQNMNYSSLKTHTYTVTEKLDGSSCTFYFHENQFGVCSRNLELLESDNNSFWHVANQYDMRQKLEKLGKSIAIQGELIGLGIQKNKYQLNKVDVRVFKVFDIMAGKYYSIDDMMDLANNLGLTTVPILERAYELPESRSTLLTYAEGQSVLAKTTREGVVLYSNEAQNVHFKVISNKFLEQ